ncbi:MAG: hypothetical protein K0U74_04250 [Alphaproteobacteria bacterium]|nr:hypothetical protein [Alphaproteobacteria bacterium]
MNDILNSAACRLKAVQLSLAPQVHTEFDMRAAGSCLLIFVTSVAINGYPFLITDTIRYAGLIPSLSDSPVTLNVVNSLPYAMLGMWGAAIVHMLAASYAIGRLATLPQFSGHWYIFPIVAVLTCQYIYAGLIGTEIWAFIGLALIARLSEGRRLILLDLVLIGIAAISHNTLVAISFGAAFLVVFFFWSSWPRVLAAALAIGACIALEAIAFSQLLPNEPRMKYIFISGEILSNHHHIYKAYCKAAPTATLCQPPYSTFIASQRARPDHQERIDRKFIGKRSQLFIWGEDSFWADNSRLPTEQRLTRTQNEQAGRELWLFARRNYLWSFFEVFPAKAQAYWSYLPPALWFSDRSWKSDSRINVHWPKIEEALSGYEGSLQNKGAYMNWRYRRLSLLIVQALIVVGLLAPVVLLLVAPGNVARLSVVFAGFVIGNFATCAVAGAIVGRYMERVYPFCAYNVALLVVVLAGIAMRRLERRHESH